MNKPTKPTKPTKPIKPIRKKNEYINTTRESSPLDQRRTNCTTPEYERLIYREQECCTTCTLQ